MEEADVNLGCDSQPPDGWAPTQPAEMPQQTVDEAALSLEPEPIEATTDFELDTSIAVDDNTPLEDVIASMTPRPAARQSTPSTPPEAPQPEPALQFSASPQPWLDEPPEDVPSTDEEDALDSRYLMPTERERRAPRRRGSGPEFADAQFPSDAFIDAEEDWASDFGPSALDADSDADAHMTSGLRPLDHLPRSFLSKTLTQTITECRPKLQFRAVLRKGHVFR